jgi:hypothetical protein
MPSVMKRQSPYPSPPPRPKRTRRAILLGALLTLCAAAAVFAVSYYFGARPERLDRLTPVQPAEKTALSVFFLNEQGKFTEKTVEVMGTLTMEEKADKLIGELKGVGVLPGTLSLDGFTTDQDGIMYLSVSKDITNGPMGTMKELNTVYGLVNSFLGSFGNVKKIQLLVEWKPVYTLGGLVCTYLPLEFNRNLMED